MKKKFLTILICVLLLLAMSLDVFAIGMNSFVKSRQYKNNFSDIVGKWSESYIADLYEYGLVDGYGDGTVGAEDQITMAEVITLAARINACYYEREIVEEGEEWFSAYVDYALRYGIVDDKLVGNVIREANRGETAMVFAKTLIAEQLMPVRQEQTFFDVKRLDKYYDAVSLLTRAGIVNGYEDMTFRPEAGITREEAMTMADRVVNKSQRLRREEVQSETECDVGADGIVPGSRDEEVGDYVIFHCEGVGVFSMNRRDEGYILSVASGKNTITVAGLCEIRGGLLLCHLGDRVVQGSQQGLGAINAMTLLFDYDKGVKMTLVGAMDATGQLVSLANSKVLGNLAIGDKFTVAE